MDRDVLEVVELAFRNFHEHGSGKSFCLQFIDAAFNQNIFSVGYVLHDHVL